MDRDLGWGDAGSGVAAPYRESAELDRATEVVTVRPLNAW
jgi:hypothetical protein